MMQIIKQLIKNDNALPELDHIKSYMSAGRLKPDSKQLRDSLGLKCLLFQSNSEATTWFLLASMGIAVADYKELYHAQHKRDIIFNYPFILHGDYELMPFKKLDHHGKPYEVQLHSIEMEDSDIKQVERYSNIGEHERIANWCPFCRGLGFIQALKFDTENTVDDIPSPVYKIRCFHTSQTVENFRKYDKTKTL